MEPVTQSTESRRLRFFKDSARERAMRITRRIIVSAAVVAGCIWLFIGGSLWSDYDGARTAAETQGFNLGAALAGELRQVLEAANKTFRLIQHEINEDKNAHPLPVLLARLEEDQSNLTDMGVR
jgi:hypothetical protein